jgi:2-amino-4-hydroxy-6-hydroxymethyldihydropteridine diphosphokinase
MSQKHLYLIALGSNQRNPRHGSPRFVLAAAAARIDKKLGKVRGIAPVIETAPIGPSRRRYANGALLLETALAPQDLLAALLRLEARFGRRRMGEGWRSRPLDCDIVLWSGGIVAEPGLLIPHPLFRERGFVLAPAAAIAPRWRDPLTGLSLVHLHARLTRPRPLPR